MKPATLAKRLGMTSQGRSKWAARFGMVKSGSDVTRADVVEHTVLRALRTAGIRDADLERSFAAARAPALSYEGGLLDLVCADSGEVAVTGEPAELLAAVRGKGRVRVVDLGRAVADADQIWQEERERDELASGAHGGRIPHR
jgi:hypothetical protein